MKLFPRDKTVGIFRGFSEGGLEFHADLVLPYRNDFQSTPMHGQFLVVQLEHEDEAVLGRITSMSSQGRLASGAGEDYGIRAVADDRPIPEDLREQYSISNTRSISAFLACCDLSTGRSSTPHLTGVYPTSAARLPSSPTMCCRKCRGTTILARRSVTSRWASSSTPGQTSGLRTRRGCR